MRLSNNAKHQLAIKLLSDYLIRIGHEHLVFSSNSPYDIYIPSSESRIKVLCNYSNVKYLKVPNDFESEKGVLYLVVKPNRKNTHGFSSVGGYKEAIDKSIHIMNEKRYIKNIEIEALKSISTKKRIENDRACVEKRDIAKPGLTSISIVYEEKNMPYNVVLTDKCKELLFDDYEEHREHGKPNTPVEDEMLRHFLEMARKEGLVESFSKKVMTVLEA